MGGKRGEIKSMRRIKKTRFKPHGLNDSYHKKLITKY